MVDSTVHSTMFRDLFGTLAQFARLRASGDVQPPLTLENGAGGIDCSLWEPEPGLFMLAIWFRPLGGSSGQEPGIIVSGNGQNKSYGIGPERDRFFPFRQAAQQRVISGEVRGRDWSERGASLSLRGESPRLQSDRLDFPGLSIDPATREVKVDRNTVDLTRREFDLLYFLARNPRHIFTHSQLLDCIWGHDYYGSESTVTVHISRLRNKLERNGNGSDLIQTVWGVGYRFDPPSEKM